MLPELGLEDGPVSALLADRPTECFLRGAVKAVPGVNVLFPPPTTPAQASWNARIRAAARASGLFPDGHHLTNDWIFPRQSGFFPREDACAVGTRVVPLACSETGESVHAIFSLFDDAAPPPVAAAAGVPALLELRLPTTSWSQLHPSFSSMLGSAMISLASQLQHPTRR